MANFTCLYFGALRKITFATLLTLVSLAVFAQNAAQVTGNVKDASGNVLPGVNVLVKGTSVGGVTDASGNYSIEVPNANNDLVFSYIGFITKEMTIDKRKAIDVILDADTKALSEVVVVGYGTAKKATLTGSVAQVKGTELQKSPTVNLSNTLVGRLPGVIAMQRSGEPGNDNSSIRIRGVNAIGNTDALVVIDGVPGRAGGLSRINPADVESVSVLKDAAAAIYGSRAANGVILITTKRGTTGKPRISYDFNYGLTQPTRIPKVADAVEYATIRNELNVFDNTPWQQWDAAWTGLRDDGSYTNPDDKSVLEPIFTQEELGMFANGSDPLRYPNTDWYGAVLRKWAPQTKHNIQMTGGSDNLKYLASLGYLKQEGYYKNTATAYNQYDFRINLDANINKNIKASLGIMGREELRQFPNGGGAGDIFRMLMRGKPTEIAIWPDGRPGPDIENGQNPAVITTNQTGYIQDKADYIQTNGTLEILIPGVEGLKVTGIAAIDKRLQRVKSFQEPWSLFFWDGDSLMGDGQPYLTETVRSTFPEPRLREQYGDELSILLTGQVDYARSFGNHNFNAMVGVQREKVDASGFNAFRRYFLSGAITELFAGGNLEQTIGSNDLFKRARLSYFGRVGYNFKERYLFEFVGRYDGSWVFPANRRFGFFPGVSAGWRVSEEDFFRGVDFVQNLKIRASWGQMGAEATRLDGSLAEYQYLSLMNFGSYIINNQVAQTLLESSVPNPDFTWEKANNTNFAIEGTMLNDRLTFELEYFYNYRTNMLIPLTGSIPASSGITDKLPPVNLGRMRNQGIDFLVNYSGSINDLTYNFGINGGYARNRILFWDETPGNPVWQRTTGRQVGAIVAYEYDGAFKDEAALEANTIDYTAFTDNLRPGDMKFKDTDGNGVINGDDRVNLDKSNVPRFSGGITGNLMFRNFDLSILFQGAMGGLQYIGQTESGDIGNFLKWSFDNRWSIDNPSSVNPRLANRGNTYFTGAQAGANTYFIRKLDYVRLKNVEFGYTIPETVGKKVGLTSARIFVSGLNLATFFDKIKLWDPETSSSNAQYYPQSRIINVGVNLTF